MFNVTGGEMLIVLVVALIVLGPEKLPDMIRKAGRLYGELRRMSNGFQSELREAFEEPTRELRETAEMARNAVTGAVGDLTTSVNQMVRPDLTNATNDASAPSPTTAEPAAAAPPPADPAPPETTPAALAPVATPIAEIAGRGAPAAVNGDLAAAIAAESAEASWPVASQPPLAPRTMPSPGALADRPADAASGAPPPPVLLPPPSLATDPVPAAAPASASNQRAAAESAPSTNGHSPAANGLAPPAAGALAPPAPLPPPAADAFAAPARMDDR